MTSQPSAEPKPLRIGVMCESVQLSDIVGIDIIGSVSKKYLQFTNSAVPIPPNLIPQAPEINFIYIASSLTEPAFMTPSLRFTPTETYDTCPRDLDILFIGGPLPTHRPAAADRFFKEAVEKTALVMSVCTGGMWLADSGVLNGKKATTNRQMLEIVRKTHPEVEWKDERWVIDGKFWTSGGAGCGLDMAIAFVRERFPKEVVDFGLASLQFGVGGGNGRFYNN